SFTLPIACAPANGEPVVLGVRPEHITVGAPSSDGAGVAAGVVTLIEPIGGEQIVHVTLGDGVRLGAMAPPDAPIAVDDSVSLRIPRDTVHLFLTRDGRRVER